MPAMTGSPFANGLPVDASRWIAMVRHLQVNCDGSGKTDDWCEHSGAPKWLRAAGKE